MSSRPSLKLNEKPFLHLSKSKEKAEGVTQHLPSMEKPLRLISGSIREKGMKGEIDSCATGEGMSCHVPGDHPGKHKGWSGIQERESCRQGF